MQKLKGAGDPLVPFCLPPASRLLFLRSKNHQMRRGCHIKTHLLRGKWGPYLIILQYISCCHLSPQYNNNKEYHLNSLFDDIKRKQSTVGWSSSIWSRAKKIKRTCVIRNYNFLLFFRQRARLVYLHTLCCLFILINLSCFLELQLLGRNEGLIDKKWT